MLMTQSAVSALQGQNSNAPYDSRSKKSAAAVSSSSTSDRHDPAAQSRYRDSPNSYAQAQAQFNQQPSMNGIVGTAPPGTMYVRALYDYEADDRTSLSFHEGDIIQVITQLESGWWDGVINGVRGWFPSNYCQIVTSPDELPEPDQDLDDDRVDEDPEDVDVYDESFEDDDDDGSDHDDDTSGLPMEGTEVDKSRADFWIPQATPDGRLFYYNTMTGESSMELPLESPSSITETGPRDRMNVSVPDKTRPPPEMMARGLMQDEEDESDVNSASELEGESIMMGTRSALVSYTRLSPSGDFRTHFFTALTFGNEHIYSHIVLFRHAHARHLLATAYLRPPLWTR